MLELDKLMRQPKIRDALIILGNYAVLGVKTNTDARTRMYLSSVPDVFSRICTALSVSHADVLCKEIQSVLLTSGETTQSNVENFAQRHTYLYNMAISINHLNFLLNRLLSHRNAIDRRKKFAQALSTPIHGSLIRKRTTKTSVFTTEELLSMIEEAEKQIAEHTELLEQNFALLMGKENACVE